MFFAMVGFQFQSVYNIASVVLQLDVHDSGPVIPLCCIQRSVLYEMTRLQYQAVHNNDDLHRQDVRTCMPRCIARMTACIAVHTELDESTQKTCITLRSLFRDAIIGVFPFFEISVYSC
jgi:hypothetical protein